MSILFFYFCYAKLDLGIILFHRMETLDGGTKLFEMILLQIKADERRCTEGTSSEDNEDMEQKGLKTYRGIIWSHRKADDRRCA